jgi:hypothetical protein
MLAQFNGECPRCGRPIVADVDRIIVRRDDAIHVGCASGADDS